MSYLKTAKAAEELGIPYSHLCSILRRRVIDSPEKDSSGDYVWKLSDLEAVREVLRERRKPEAVPA